MVHDLGDLITLGLVVAALIVVPYKIAKAWIWPLIVGRPVNHSDQPPPARAPVVMSNDRAEDRPMWAVADPVATMTTPARQPIATPDNDDNAGLTDNAPATPIPSEAREIIRMQAKAEVVVKLLQSAKLTNKAEAIELIFECSRSSRAGSTYQQALAMVNGMIDRYPNRTPEQDEARQRLGLA